MATRGRSCAMLLLVACALLATQYATAAPISLLSACGVKATSNTSTLTKNCVFRKSMVTADAHLYQAETGPYDLVIIVRFAGTTTAQVLVGGNELMPLDGNRTTAVGGVLTAQGGSISIVPYADGLPVVYTMMVSPRTFGGPLAPAHQKVLSDLHTACCADDTTESCKSLASPEDICTEGYTICAKGLLTQLVLPGELNCKTGLPASFATLTSLQSLDLSSSNIIQEANALFAMFGDMGALEHIHLARNSLSGPLSDEVIQFFGQAGSLRTIDVSSNALAGNMSNVLLGVPTIESVSLANNKLNGPIPEVPVAAADTNASLLDASGSRLQVVDLSNNELSDTAATALMGAPLMYLDLHSNNISFSLPATQTKFLVYYDVSGNSLTASQFLTSATTLVYIDVSGNPLQGGIGGLGAFVPNSSPLRYFYAADAGIFNEIPAKLGAIPTLREIDISGNQLSGNLDAFAAAIPANNTLMHFNASNNRLDGGIPDALQAAAMFVQTSPPPATFFSEDDRPAIVPAIRIFDVSGNTAMSGDFPMWLADAAARNAEADRAAGYDPLDTVLYSVAGTNLVCPDTPNEVKLDATGVIAIQNLGITCYDNTSKIDVGLQDALYKVVPGLPAPPPPPIKFISRPGPSKSAKTWKGVGIALGVLFAVALVGCIVFAYKYRDLDLKLKQRYHKQDGDEFKQNYVVSPRAGDADDLENGKHNGL